MEEQIKRIEIPDFITIKIVKINNKHCAYYVEDYNNEYFCANENGYLKTQPKAISFWALSINMPMIEDNINIQPLEEDVYKLYRILKPTTIPRAELKQNYYIIDSDFAVRKLKELNYNFDYRHHSVQNYFLSESQAKRYAGKMQEYLMELWKEEIEKK